MPRPDNMMGKLWLAWIALSLLSFLILEAYGYYRFGTPGTLSGYIRAWSSMHELVPFGLGFTIGLLAYHFWATTS